MERKVVPENLLDFAPVKGFKKFHDAIKEKKHIQETAMSFDASNLPEITNWKDRLDLKKHLIQ